MGNQGTDEPVRPTRVLSVRGDCWEDTRTGEPPECHPRTGEACGPYQFWSRVVSDHRRRLSGARRACEPDRGASTATDVSLDAALVRLPETR